VILFLTDTDGDDIAIDTDAIYAVSVGEARRPALVPDDDAPREKHTVTLVHTLGGPLVVSQSWEAVVDAWQRGVSLRSELVRDVTAPRGGRLMEDDDDVS
jgi:hypothetical protein